MGVEAIVIFTCILSLLEFDLISCEIGGYTQWREKLAFMPCDPVPDCASKCNERCGPDHKGVSVCGSLLEKVDNIPCMESANSTQVSTYVVMIHSCLEPVRNC